LLLCICNIDVWRVSEAWEIHKFRSWLHTWLQLLVVSWLQKLKIRVLCCTCWGTHILYNIHIYSFVYARIWSFSYLWIQKIHIMVTLIFYGPFIFHLTWYITSILCALSCLSYFLAGFFYPSFSFLLLKICDGAKY